MSHAVLLMAVLDIPTGVFRVRGEEEWPYVVGRGKGVKQGCGEDKPLRYIQPGQ